MDTNNDRLGEHAGRVSVPELSSDGGDDQPAGGCTTSLTRGSPDRPRRPNRRLRRLIPSIVDDVVSEVHLARIILFSSVARGGAGAGW